jgi:hypothetical protein
MPDQGRNDPKAKALYFLRQHFRQFTVALCLTPDCEGIAVRFYKGELLCRKHYLARHSQEANKKGRERG